MLSKILVAVFVLGLSACVGETVQPDGVEGALIRPLGPFVVTPVAPFGCSKEFTTPSLLELCAGRDVIEYAVADQYVLICNIPTENRLVQFDPVTQTGVFSLANTVNGYACVSVIQ